MSLILEALRKLEREKKTPERGLVVTGAATWARPEERRVARVAGVLLAGLALAAGFWLLRGRPEPPPGGAQAGAGPAASGSTPDDTTARPPAAATPAAAAPDVAPVPTAVPVATARGTAAVEPGTPVTPPQPQPREAGGAPPDPPAPATSAEERTPQPEPPAADEAPAAEPQAASGTGGERVVLQAVSERDGRPVAIVNGRLVREGDRFDGITILHIRKNEIEVEVDGRRRTISF